jgi:pimeloyl-ACP methyl ester carboxylesterase
MNLAEWRSSGSHINFQGHKIFVRVEGDGDPMLILHGFPTASYDYARLTPLLADRYRLYLFDFLGYGFSDKPHGHHYSLFEQADITQMVANYFGLTDVTILTHDMGNSVTLELLRRAQPSAKRIIMLNGSVLLDHYRPVITQKLLLNPTLGPIISNLRLIRRPIFARQFGKLFAQQPSSEEINEFWQLILHNNGIANYHLLIRYLNERKVHEHEWLDVLKASTVPLTVIWGQRDPVSVPKIAGAILERRPDTDYHPLEGVGHFPQWEAPRQVASIIN